MKTYSHKTEPCPEYRAHAHKTVLKQYSFLNKQQYIAEKCNPVNEFRQHTWKVSITEMGHY